MSRLLHLNGPPGIGLERLQVQRPDAVVIASAEGEVDETCRSLLESLG